MASISIERKPLGGVDLFRRYRVLIDGNEVGRIGRGERQAFEVDPGPHQVRLKIDWCWSEPVDLQVAEGDEVALVCEPNANVITFIYYATGAYDRYIKLSPA